jgi:hypothetical protein
MVLGALLIVSACGSSSSPAAATVASVAVQPGDLPSGVQRCGVSADINTYLSNIKSTDPSVYTTTQAQWADAQSKGATAAQVVFYTDSAADCANVASNVSSLAAATYKLVVNFVIKFKDEATATSGYTSGKIFGVDQSTLKVGGTPFVAGIKTGLGANSIVLSATIANQSFYISVWQNKTFMVILGIINFDSATGQKAAAGVNKRIV